MPMNDLYTSDRKGVGKSFVQETANEVGVYLADYNPDITARDAGRVGGKITQKLVSDGKNSL